MTDIAATTAPLWTRARAMYARAIAAVGAPPIIAAVAAFSALIRAEIVGWLSPLEHIVRKLLLADAAALQRAEAARAKRRVRIEHVPLRGMAHAWTAGLQTRISASTARNVSDANQLDSPETWRARFSFALARNPSFVANAQAPRIRALWGHPQPEPPPRTPRILAPHHAPFRLARRFEALRRVLDNPAPYARRLAQLLVREVRRYAGVVRRAVLTGPRTDKRDPEDPRLSVDAIGAAIDAPEAFMDSS